jgi:DinB superfamily
MKSMNSRDAIKIGLDMADFVCMAYLNDMTDAEFMHRPHAECNHINWQVGHLVVAENEMMSKIPDAKMPALPAGFAAKYHKNHAKSDDPSQFVNKSELMATYKSQREATLRFLASVSDSDLDKATGIDYAPSLGSLFSMQGSHWLMHCGQWVVVRRELGKPVVI